jgi:protein-disulfide isomerase
MPPMPTSDLRPSSESLPRVSQPIKLAPVDRDDHVRGNAGARTVIVEYADYDCPHSKRAHESIMALLDELGDDVCFVFRHFPLRERHPHAQMLAELAEASSFEGDFWPMHDYLMRHREGTTVQQVLEGARRHGIKIGAVDMRLGTDALLGRIEQDLQSGRAASVKSTPSFFFDGRLHGGGYDEETLRKRFEEARARAGTIVR